MKLFNLLLLACIFMLSVPNHSLEAAIKVQVVNAAPDPHSLGNMRVTIKDKVYSPEGDIPYLKATKFIEIPDAGNVEVVIDYNLTKRPVTLHEGNIAILVSTGVKVPEVYDNPFNRKITPEVSNPITGAMPTIADGKIKYAAFHASSDAPKFSIRELGTGKIWINNLDYKKFVLFNQNSAMDAKKYIFEVINSADSSVIGTYEADLSVYSGKTVLFLASGFIDPVKNQDGPKFAMNMVLADGNVVEMKPYTYVKPERATLINPSDNAMGIDTAGNFLWHSTYGTVSYTLLASERSDFTTTIILQTEIKDTALPYQSFKSNTKYWWKVQAVNPAGAGQWSPVYSFTTKKPVQIPEKIELDFPSDSAIDRTVAGTFKWKASSQDATYDLQIAKDADFASIILDTASLPENSYAYKDLDISTKYFWHVRAVNVAGIGEWSAPRSFVTKNNISVEDGILAGEIRIYPNPASDYLTVDLTGFQTIVKSLKLYDVNGNLVYVNENIMGQSRFEVPVKGLANGMYNMEIIDVMGRKNSSGICVVR